MGKETLVIADLHLRGQAPEVTRRLLALEPRLRQAEAIYILGDLVEAWIGDDAPIPDGLAPAFDLLKRLSSAGIPLFFQHGNRDFLIGTRVARRLGITLLPDEHLLKLHGHRMAMVHGDQLCTDDLAYQKLRRKLRNPVIQFILRHLPLRTRQRMATGLRDRSKRETGRKAAAIMDVNAGAVGALMRRLGVNVLIHGHTHRPAIHQETSGLRAVLGDWERAAIVLSLRPEGLSLERIEDDGKLTVMTAADWPAPSVA